MTVATGPLVTRFDLRVAWRMHRFELAVLGVLTALAVIAALWVSSQLDATGYVATCFGTGSNTPDCNERTQRFFDLAFGPAQMIRGVMVALPFLLALLVGAPLVGREVERGTGRLAWSLAPSRVRWYLSRLLPALGAVAILALVAGLALDRLVAATSPGINPFLAFDGFGSRGAVLAARVVFVFALAVAAGALLGRVLPALLLAAVVGYVGLVGGSWAHGRILATEGVIASNDSGVPGDLFLDQRIRTPSGELITWERLEALGADGVVTDPETAEIWPPDGYQVVAIVLPGERYPFVAAREIAVLVAGSLVVLIAGAVITRRRRPR